MLMHLLTDPVNYGAEAVFLYVDEGWAVSFRHPSI